MRQLTIRGMEISNELFKKYFKNDEGIAYFITRFKNLHLVESNPQRYWLQKLLSSVRSVRVVWCMKFVAEVNLKYLCRTIESSKICSNVNGKLDVNMKKYEIFITAYFWKYEFGCEILLDQILNPSQQSSNQ